MAEIKFLDSNGVKKVFSVVKAKYEAGDTSTLTTAKKYTDDQIAAIPDYVLPVASTSTLGGVKQGVGVSIDSNGVISATGTAAVDPSALPIASQTSLGGVKIGNGVTIDSNGAISVSHPDVYTKAEADGKFQTAAQVTSIASAEVAKIVDGAPEALNTLKEIADTLNADTEGGVVNSIMTEIGKKADQLTVNASIESLSQSVSQIARDINGKADISAVETAKTEAISAAATDAASKYVLKTDMPTFTGYTDTEIDAIAAQVFV